ncbi:MAG: glycoside hydrolase family 3 C-terminal domain-containing protein [Prevotellaceae bacterium]|jgi:beta-glucosidase|nr:glycoside hydrolase family 3 C-terminal domain-containing protein [Prevotellaceae bacterium]
MKKISLFLCIAALFVACNSNKTPQLGKSSVDKVIAAMTLEEKVQLLIGTGMADFSGDSAVIGETKSLVPGAAGTTCPIPRLGIPAIVLADGPAGLRIQPAREGDSQTYYCTAFPVGTLLASTWNTELVENVGKAMGNEVLEYGADVLLGPALNIHRNPLCGRNFEYYSEDPLLSGKMAAAMVKGVQSNGVGTSIKHFAANNQETNRMANDARMSARALREIYLKGFEIAVKESQPQTVMTSYNYINGTYASESRELLTNILRDEWGYKGTVMTDWFGGKNPPAQVHAGNDLLMPGTVKQYESIIAAVNDDSLSVADVDRNVKRILQLILDSPRFKGYKYSNHPDLKAHAEVTRESAAEGMVLLKNTDNVLPFKENIKNIAAFGITSYEFISGGTGSGDVNEAYTVSLKEGLTNAGYSFNTELADLYEKHIAAENEKNKPDPNNPFAMFMPKIRATEILPNDAQLKKIAVNSDIALLTLGRNSGEFADRKISDDFDLSADEQKLIQDICKIFHAASKKVIVVLNIGGVIETASWKELPDGILLAWQAGQEGGNTVADVLKGAVNPSGKLPMTFPVNYMDAASSANFPYDYVPGPPVMFPAGEVKKDLVKNVDYTNYEEDIYVGYRYFDTFNKNVSYPFGYGLSYTTFEYTNPTIKKNKGIYTVTVDVKNTGSVAGKEVVQLYVSAPGKSMNKPAKELKAFAKTKFLQPDETQTIQLKLTPDALASFDEANSRWTVEAGDYTGQIGSSSGEIKQNVKFDVPKEIIVEKTHNVMNPKEVINKLK